jgi:hypothetical protein
VSAELTLRGQRTWHVRKLFAREPGDLLPDHLKRVARARKVRSRS